MRQMHSGIVAGTAALCAVCAAHAGMTGLSLDVVGTNVLDDPTSNYTIRLYADLDPGSRLDAVFGNSIHTLSLDVPDGALLYQNGLGGPTSQSINPYFFFVAPSLQWDSFMTIGRLTAADNEMQDIGIWWWDTFEEGGSVATNDGLWFVLPTAPQGEPVDGRVLIAQLTVFPGASTEAFTFEAGFQGHDALGETWQSAHSIAWVPAPGAAGMFMMAWTSHLRRRRRAA